MRLGRWEQAWCVVGIACLVFAVMAWTSAVVRADGPGSIPVMGFGSYDNEYRAKRTLIARLTLDTDPAGVVLWGGSSFTTAPDEVISGKRSVKLSGAGQFLTIAPAVLHLDAGEVYALEYDYRILDRAGAVSVMNVAGVWGPSGELHADPWGLRPDLWGEEGVQRRQFRFGEGPIPSFALATQESAVVVVDNLRVWHIASEAVPSTPRVLALGYPRVSDFNFDSPHAGAFFNDVPVAPYEEMLGRFDLVNGVQIDHTIGDTSWAERMIARNPSIILAPFRHTFMAPLLDHKDPLGGSAGLRELFNRAIPDAWIMRNPDGDPLMDQIFEGNTQLDPTWYCPTVDGVTFAGFLSRFVSQAIMPAGLWNAIHFDQAEWFPNPLLAQTINGPLPPIDMDRDGVTDSKPLMFGTMRVAFSDFFALVRKDLGFSRIIYGNPGRIPLDSSVLRVLNGWQQEILTLYEILPGGEWDTTRSAHWHDFLRNYLTACAWTPSPQVISVQATGIGLGVPTGTLTGHGYPNRVPALEPRDYRRMRMSLATVLLGNGFFGYDLVDNTTPPVWFDEYAVDASGAPTTDLSGKGYLGQPVGTCAEITRPEPVIFETGFEDGIPEGMWVSENAAWTVDPAEVIEGDASLVTSRTVETDFMVFEVDPSVVPVTSGKTYDLTATFRVLSYTPESYASFVSMGIGDDPYGVDFNGRSYVYYQDIEGPGQVFTLRTQVKAGNEWFRAYAYMADDGTVAVDSVRMTEVRGGAFRRDFERGVVVVNPTPEPIDLTQAEIAGPLGRTGIRRIAGVQDPATNNGQVVTDGLTIPPCDGIVLLADPIGAPLPVTPSVVIATSDGSEPAIDLVWSTPPGGTCAGYQIEYRIAGTDHWDRFEFSGPGSYHRIGFLDPGTSYEVRIASFDFAGRMSAFTTPVSATTIGVPPVRSRIVTIDPMTRSSVAVIQGELLAGTEADLTATYPYIYEDTRITVNGVPARLIHVAPGYAAIEVPPTVAIGPCVVRAFRGEVGSTGYPSTVLPEPPPACVGDSTGDHRTNVADFLIIASNFGRFVSIGHDGDLDMDGRVSVGDVNILAGDYGCGH